MYYLSRIAVFALILSAGACSVHAQTPSTPSHQGASMSYENSPWAKNPLPQEFSFASRDWFKDDVDDSVNSTVTVKKLESNIYSITFDIHSKNLSDKTYDVQGMHFFSYLVIGRLVHQLGYSKFVLGLKKTEEDKGLSKKQVIFVGMTGAAEKEDKERISAYKSVNFESGFVDLPAASELLGSPAVKPEYLW
ncbi:MAG TPA: hypothetical protein VF450_07960 [Noviherbaspirillum sp.]